jgi:S1-C subfamily serine protease
MGILHKKFYESVVSINIVNNSSSIVTIGSGFLISYKNLKYVITNKHVLQGINSFLVNLSGSTSKNNRHMIFKIGDGYEKSYHPNPNVDLVAIEISIERNLEGAYYLPLERTSLKIKDLKSMGVFEGDEIFIIGHPMNLTLENHLFPIVRSGVIAQISPLYEFESELKSFKLDCLAFPGNSGSPVYLKPQFVTYKDTQSIKEMKLIGIMNGGWQSKNPNNQLLNLELTSSIAVDHLFELLNHKISEQLNN